MALLISCQNGHREDDKSILRLNSASGISSLDPAFARTQENIRAVNQLFNGLVELDSQLNVQACIAKDWKISDDGKLYTFTLRNDVLFHKHPLFHGANERRVTAADFCYSFERIIAPETASDGAWIFNGIIAEDSAFVALSDTVFQIRLRKAFAPLINMLSMAYCSVVPQEIVERTSFDKEPVGTGPFRFANWAEGIRLNFVRNDEYFAATAQENIPYIDAVSFSFIESKQTALLQLLQGQLDVFTGLESSFKDEILSANGGLNAKYKDQFELLVSPFLNTEYLAFNMEDANSPFQHIALRKAVNLAIDRNAMIKYLRNGIGEPAFGGFVPKGLPQHVPGPWNTQDVEEAKRLVAQVPVDQRAFTLTTTKEYQDLCVLVQSDLKKVGLDMAIDVIPSSLIKQQKSAGDLQFFRSSWIADYPDGENYMACFYGPNKAPNGPNYCRYNSAAFDRMYEQLIASNSDSLKRDLIDRMEQELMANAPFVLLFYDESIWLTPKQIKGLRINALNHLDLRRVHKP